jgi:hypothetical protein
MKKNLIAAAAATMVFVSGVAIAQEEQEMPNFAPVETYTCNYKEGMGSDDLDGAIDTWNAWMDDEGMTNYFAATLVPAYYGPETFDFGWLGFYPTGSEMGAGTDHYLANGGEHRANFAAVADCDTHSGFASTRVKEAYDDGEENDGSFVLTFTDCTITTDGDEDILGAIGEWNAYKTESGYKHSAFVWFPVYGGGGAEFDFKMLQGYDDFSALGEDWERIAKGDYVKAGEFNPDLYECDDARVYLGTVRREIPEEEE